MKVFIGYDSREDIAYKICKFSIERRTKFCEIIPLNQQDLKNQGIYKREIDSLSSTEFTFTRFLVPYLCNYKEWVLFCDCDFLFQIDIKELFNQIDDQYAVMVVKHNYNPSEGIKMDGQKQIPYFRKNWSSLILWNCSHIANKKLTPDLVNTESGQYLHRFQWLDDKFIGSLNHEYNWLVNWYSTPKDGIPKAIHYTEGGPWFDNYKDCEFSAHWKKELVEYEKLQEVCSISS